MSMAKRVRVVQTDNGVSFRTGPVHNLLVQRGISHVLSSTSTPQPQGVAERANQAAKRWLYASAKEKYGNPLTRNDGRTSWIRLVVDMVQNVMNDTVQQTTKKTPNELFREEQRDNTVVGRLKVSAARRYYSRVYKERTLKAGDKVILSMRISANGPFHVRDAIAKGEHKIYKSQWDTSHTYTIERPYGDHSYRLVELQGNYDRTDLLRVPQ